MFGKPQWFRKKRWGWGLTPTCWQGWCYVLVWVVVIDVPFVAFLVRGQPSAAAAWLIAAIAVLLWDVAKIIRAIDAQQKQSSPETKA